MDQCIHVPSNVRPIQLLGSAWECLVKRTINAITVGGPITIEVVELLRIQRAESRPNQKADDVEMPDPQTVYQDELDIHTARRTSNPVDFY